MDFKWLTLPWSNRTKQVQVVQLWEVRWQSRHGEYHSDLRPELEAFTSEKEAKEFAAALEYAFRLLPHTSGTYVALSKGKSV